MKHTYTSLLPRPLRRGAQRGLLLLGLAGLLPVAQAQVSLAPVVTYSAPGSPQGIVSADFNGDGRPDLATANSSGSTVNVLLQSSAARGTFLGATTYSSGGTFAVVLATGDLNGDGRPDLAVINQSSNSIGVLLNSATTPGTFAAAVSYSTGGTSSRGIAVADVDGDGRLDLVAGNAASISVLLQSRTTPGTFGSPTNYASGNGAGSTDEIAVSDLNGDGRPDIVGVNNNTNTVSVLLNSATTPGTFPAVTNYTISSSNIIVRGLAVGDLNNDGRPDIVAGNASNNFVSVLLNSATTPGTFGAATNYASNASTPLGIALGDLNGDGLADIVTENYTSSTTVGILLNSAAAPGTFPTSPTGYGSGGSVPFHAVVRDLNGDGQADIAVTNYSSDNVGILLNATVLAPTVTTLSPTTGPVGTSVTITGTNLSGATAVSFNGTAASSFVVNSATSITAVVAAGTTTGLVRVTTPGGTATSPNNFVVRVAPTTVADTYTTPQNVTLTGNVLTNDIGTNPRAILITRPTNGTLVLNPDGSFTYQPAAGYTGPDSFTYYACDPALPLLCGNPVTVSITVVRVAPITVADAYSTPQGVLLTGNVLTNDIGTNPRAILITRPTRGTLVLNPDGSFSYQPNAGYVGPDSFTYYACAMGTPLLCGDPATVSINVVSAGPASVSLLYQTGDLGMPTDEQVRPFFQLVNTGGTAVPYSQLTIRYWLTAENFMGQLVTTVDWVKLGTSLVSARYVALATPRQGAFGYIEYSFAAAAGNLAAGANSGDIYGKAYKPDYSNFDETDDWSYQTSSSYTTNSHVTVYQNGTLINGTEPTAVAATTALQVLTASRDASSSTSSVGVQLQVRNTGNVPVNYSDVKVRYYLTRDGASTLVANIDFAKLGASNINVRVVNLAAPVNGADAYVELTFSAALGVFYPRTSTDDILAKIRRDDFGTLNQTNDYSFSGSMALAVNTRTPAYLNNSLVFGTPPAGAPAIVAPTTQASAKAAGSDEGDAPASASREAVTLALTGSPNPFSEQLRLTFALPTAQAYTLAVYDAQGRLVQQLASGQAEAGQPQELAVPTSGYATGLYLVRLTTASGTQLLKLIKH